VLLDPGCERPLEPLLPPVERLLVPVEPVPRPLEVEPVLELDDPDRLPLVP
jgi:hypothetical protein